MRVAAAASFLAFGLGSCASIAKRADNYAANAQTALTTLNQWYNRTSGLWDSTGWWNSANAITVLADLSALDPAVLGTTLPIFQNTFVQAQQYNLDMSKTIASNGLINSFYGNMYPFFPPGFPRPNPIKPGGFLDGYYDDEGWYALAWIAVYDLTHEPQYLQAAQTIFTDMTGGWTTPCGGGIWWDKSHTAVNAIANELFLSVASHLANRVPSQKSYYLSWAEREWAWFRQSGMINAQNNINDGLNLTTCKNNGETVWTYNQGVILGGLVELNRAAPSASYLPTAQNIAMAAIKNLTDANDILHDVCEPSCGADGSQFKGIFMRNLQILQGVAPQQEYTELFTKNAESIWSNDRNGDNQLSLVWSGPFVQPANASTQSSAMDALVAAASVSYPSWP